MFINQEGKMQSRKIDQWTQRGMLVEAIISIICRILLLNMMELRLG